MHRIAVVNTLALVLALSCVGTILADESDTKELSVISTGSTKFVPLVIVGEGWSQQFLLKNVDDDDAASGTIEFFTADGEPWEVELDGMGAKSLFFLNMLPGQMALLETAVKFDGQVLGFAKVDFGCCPDVVAQSIFRKQTQGRPDLLTSVPVTGDTSETLHIPFDNRDGKFAGVGILTTDSCFSFSCETKMRIRFRDANGTVFHEANRIQKNETLHWFSLSADYPQTVGRVGSVEVVDGNDEDTFDFINLVGFSLQFTPNAAFTSIVTMEN